MSTAQSKAATYAFLSRPPPQKKRPTQALPLPPPTPCVSSVPNTRRRSNTFSSIANWAASVQPGSPAPISPRRRPSVGSRRPSLTRRRPSITSTRVPSASFLNLVETPTTGRKTPSAREIHLDLSQLGYSVGAPILKGPQTAGLPAVHQVKSDEMKFPFDIASIPIPPIPQSPRNKTLTGSRSRAGSFSFLGFRGRSKSVSGPTSPRSKSTAKMTAKLAATSEISKRKKGTWGKVVELGKENIRKQYVLPWTLQSELELNQLLDGGSMESVTKSYMHKTAKAAGVAGVDGVHIDAVGVVWRDQDEEMEYAHLLGDDGNNEDGGEWVEFNDEDVVRRESVSTQGSSLDPCYVMDPTVSHNEELAFFGGGGVSSPIVGCKPGMSVLSIPSRPKRSVTHLHLHKPTFLINSFPISSPTKTPLTPKSPRMFKPKGKARRRPAPLKLSPPSPAYKRPSNSPIDAMEVKKAFLDASFAPQPAPPTARVAVDGQKAMIKKKASLGKFLRVGGGGGGSKHA
ncbi:hypothetical protein JAAARDRAFT_525584 [Jaapia argillacea MUCL 33604]|uniref:Uncharacterized protein n=1 Tax=Jaapia argillacea MUCL 33604 TaxID=933084 RepID=A0A067QH31_9AGAM|nr:hypothetical protein JAAARDRAFT_525584 [Jaapia argillacea MUCL 33604]